MIILCYFLSHSLLHCDNHKLLWNVVSKFLPDLHVSNPTTGTRPELKPSLFLDHQFCCTPVLGPVPLDGMPVHEFALSLHVGVPGSDCLKADYY